MINFAQSTRGGASARATIGGQELGEVGLMWEPGDVGVQARESVSAKRILRDSGLRLIRRSTNLQVKVRNIVGIAVEGCATSGIDLAQWDASRGTEPRIPAWRVNVCTKIKVADVYCEQ